MKGCTNTILFRYYVISVWWPTNPSTTSLSFRAIPGYLIAWVYWRDYSSAISATNRVLVNFGNYTSPLIFPRSISVVDPISLSWFLLTVLCCSDKRMSAQFPRFASQLSSHEKKDARRKCPLDFYGSLYSLWTLFFMRNYNRVAHSLWILITSNHTSTHVATFKDFAVLIV